MSDQAVKEPLPTLPSKVLTFAFQKQLHPYLSDIINLTRQAFPESALGISLGEDAEEEAHQYIALDVAVGNLNEEQLLTRQSIWSAGIYQICPSDLAVYFVLGWK